MKTGSFSLGSGSSRGNLPDSPRNGSLSVDAAHALGVDALAYLGAESERLERFLRVSGLNPADFREIAARGELLPAVLDYLASDEPLLLAFCESGNHDPRNVILARNRFGGAPLWDST
jgi:Protein of unknown function (DUF3572)